MSGAPPVTPRCRGRPGRPVKRRSDSNGELAELRAPLIRVRHGPGPALRVQQRSPAPGAQCGPVEDETRTGGRRACDCGFTRWRRLDLRGGWPWRLAGGRELEEQERLGNSLLRCPSPTATEFSHAEPASVTDHRMVTVTAA